MAARRGQKPRQSAAAFPEPAPTPDYQAEPPKFCLHYLRGPFDVHTLDARQRASFAKTLQKLSCSQWRDLILADKYGCGSEFIPAAQIKAPIPPKFRTEERFMVFRYDGKLPMAGVRVRDIYHVLWIERWFGELYDHD